MRIERVDNCTVKCYISIEEMEQYQVKYTDFITRTQKAQQLMHDIIRQAQEQVDYHPPKLAFEMQITMVPEEGMVLTFSEKEPFDVKDEDQVEEFINNLKGLMGRLAEYRKEVEKKATAGGLLPGVPRLSENDEHKKLEDAANEAIFVFLSIADAMNFVDMLPGNIRIDSRLYKMDDRYFLYLGKGSASYDKYARTCVQALEFASLYRAGSGCCETLNEHGECLIAEKAVKKLRGMQ